MFLRVLKRFYNVIFYINGGEAVRVYSETNDISQLEPPEGAVAFQIFEVLSCLRPDGSESCMHSAEVTVPVRSISEILCTRVRGEDRGV